MIQYTEKTSAMGTKYIEAIDGDKLMQIPIDPANSEYQVYLKRDEPQASHFPTE